MSNTNTRITDILRSRLVRQMRKAHEGEDVQIKARLWGVSTLESAAKYLTSKEFKEFADQCSICAHQLTTAMAPTENGLITCHVTAHLMDPDFYKAR